MVVFVVVIATDHQPKPKFTGGGGGSTLVSTVADEMCALVAGEGDAVDSLGPVDTQVHPAV